MRVALLSLLLVLSAGLAGAQQASDLTEVRVSIVPFATSIAPLGMPGTTPVTITLPCVAPGADPQRSAVNVWVKSSPAWANPKVIPDVLETAASKCNNGRVTLTTELVVSVSDRAPAFRPEPLEVAAAWEGGLQNATGAGSTDVEAGYFAILDVLLAKTMETAKPGERAVFPLKLTNLGNADTRVHFELVDVADGFEAEVPADIVLQSAAQGGAQISIDVDLVVTAAPGVGYVNKVGVVTYRIVGTHATVAGLEADEASVSLVVTSKGADTPGPGLAAALGALALVAYFRRR